MALKRVALEASTSVAELVRALASGLAGGVITPDELLGQVRKGIQVMEKIPTIFDRGDDFKVLPKPREGCEWVFAGEGRPTEKLDGTNVRLTIRSGHVVRVEKRRNSSKLQKQQGIIDGWYVDADEHGPEDKWIFEAVRGTEFLGLAGRRALGRGARTEHSGQPARARQAHGRAVQPRDSRLR